MAAGCIPVVINKGGQKEILGEELAALLWNSEADCLDITLRLINDKNYFQNFQEISLKRVRKFSEQEFEKILWEMF
jgi:hypothetical protein